MRKLVETRGCRRLFLPSYSPDFNPIEEAFSKIKVLVRRAEARTRDALVEAIGRALAAVSKQDVWGFFVHCGYSLSGSIMRNVESQDQGPRRASATKPTSRLVSLALIGGRLG